MLEIFNNKSSTIYLLFCLILWNIMLHIHFIYITCVPPAGIACCVIHIALIYYCVH